MAQANIKLETRIYNLDGVKHVEELIPPLYVVVDTYTPSSCPWNSYGMKHVRELSNVLTAKGIEHVCLITNRTKLFPRGSGPNGRVRLGDDMLPGIYRVAVPKHLDMPAEEAFREHRINVNNWLHRNGPMPEACRT